MSEHTPTPWTCRGQSVFDTSEHTVSLAYCGTVAGAGVCKDGQVRSFGVNEATANANAAFIVKAVNSHEPLVAELRRLHEICGHQTTADILAAVGGSPRGS
jgi:hypothetical protein